MREWSRVSPEDPTAGEVLKALRFSFEDRKLIARIKQQTSLRFQELRAGVAIQVDAHVGVVRLSGVEVVIMPKLSIKSLMRMVAYAFELSDLVVPDCQSEFGLANHGFVDLLGLSLLRAVEGVVRGGLLPNYESRIEDLCTLRGRLDLRHIATHPRSTTLRCRFDDFTADHPVNQMLAAGLRLAAMTVSSQTLKLDLLRSADRYFGDLSRVPLDARKLAGTLSELGRRFSHYGPALRLIQLLHQGARLGDHVNSGEAKLSSFLLNMNLLFERFLGKYLEQHAPNGIRVESQATDARVFQYVQNHQGWRHPIIRPDFVLRDEQQVLAVADAKYKNRSEHPPTTAELYQLTTYGLAYPMSEPREVLLLHPLPSGLVDRPAELMFGAGSVRHQVRIRVVGVPIDRMLQLGTEPWWPFCDAVMRQTRSVRAHSVRRMERRREGDGSGFDPGL